MNKDLGSKLKNFTKAYNALAVVFPLDWRDNDITRDSLIQRFEFTIETCWKFYQVYLSSKGVEAPYPKDVFRKVLESNLINETEAELCLEMVDDRNLTSHTYEEDLAAAIADRIVSYEPVLAKLAAKAAELVS